MASVPQFYKDLQEKYRAWIIREGENAIRRMESYIGKNSLVGDTPYIDGHHFDWLPRIESQWRLVQQELDILLEKVDQLPNFQDISRDQYDVTNDDRWKTYFFYAYGVRADRNCKQCPETTRLIESIPGLNTAFFSILMPHKQIPVHRGPYKGVVRMHLPLRVPEPATDCALRIGGDLRHWEEGKSILFDDTYPHDAWNNTDGIRAVLFLDFVRPMRFPASLVNRFLLQLISWSPYIQGEKPNFEEWDRRMEKLFSKK
ncbi:MAG: aspartyl/asparaginyl beta-hydroxylase domain-containing protein [Oculatellaceae cyanobacterium Prado106]|jgi:beta-hydroxylase|nr:aspartyl/asparaginyl beta-hydroxylase domain-containing protein [Oculatellaceae cyanobacterium Prado106]